MIRQHFGDDLAELNREIMKMGVRVEESVNKAVDSLKNKDIELAQQVIDEDDIIDEMEKDLCDKCALIIAREQPVAGDLRHLISGIKIITDIERIADHAVHVAKGAINMAGTDYFKPLVDIPRMAKLGCSMLSRAVAAYVEKNAQDAMLIAAEDKLLDDLHKQVVRELLTYMISQPQNIEGGLSLMYISRFLERIGDHVRNICEWVVFAETGEHENL
ncbi:phosphate signaling complex protein PhoU [Oceanispirochaeta sp.]|uniref:phosphate signaling complex protein PhoU n=1 Tax=Oceanispirochaeta sp. TaxID=2035350 RepID=UPI002604B47D|nr:phosphate signaling complex protein PhoU [Oceanispirochaeta sp.]MDA3955817.1 phosphate signaling complex protein PhoU [Oceanispirochaeta sp.]